MQNSSFSLCTTSDYKAGRIKQCPEAKVSETELEVEKDYFVNEMKSRPLWKAETGQCHGLLTIVNWKDQVM